MRWKHTWWVREEEADEEDRKEKEESIFQPAFEGRVRSHRQRPSRQAQSLPHNWNEQFLGRRNEKEEGQVEEVTNVWRKKRKRKGKKRKMKEREEKNTMR